MMVWQRHRSPQGHRPTATASMPEASVPLLADRHYQWTTLLPQCSSTKSSIATPMKCSPLTLTLSTLVVLGLSVALLPAPAPVAASPVFVDNPSLAQFQSGRNIRHLPCIVRKSGRSGVCMFAIDCIKQNGTHLGTCIDRFYFGSCCQLNEQLAAFAPEISDNNIEQNTISHFAHEATTLPTSALFRPITESHSHTHLSDEVVRNVSQSSLAASTIVHNRHTTKPVSKRPRPTQVSATTPKASQFVVRSTTRPHTQKPYRRKTTTAAPVLTTTAPKVEERVESTTLPTKFVTFQIVETTTMEPTEDPSRLAVTPTALLDLFPTARPRPRPTSASLVTSGSGLTTFNTIETTVKPPPFVQTMTTRPNPMSAQTKPSHTKRPDAESTKKPMDSSINETILPVASTSHSSPTVTSSPARRPTPGSDVITSSLPPRFNASRPTLATQSTHAPRPRPRPTATVVKVPKPTFEEETTVLGGRPTAKPSPTRRPSPITAPPRTTTEGAPSSTAAPKTSTTPVPATTKAPTTTTSTSTTTTTTSAPTTTTATTPTRKPTTSSTQRTTTTSTSSSSSSSSTTTSRPTASSSTTVASMPPTKPPPVTTDGPRVPSTSTTTQRPGLVTWTTVDERPSVDSSSTESSSEDWQQRPQQPGWIPLATTGPDGSHKLPTDGAITTPPPVALPSSTTQKVIVSVSSSVSEIMSNSSMAGAQKPIKVPKPKPTKKPTTTTATTTTTTTTRGPDTSSTTRPAAASTSPTTQTTPSTTSAPASSTASSTSTSASASTPTATSTSIPVVMTTAGIGSPYFTTDSPLGAATSSVMGVEQANETSSGMTTMFPPPSDLEGMDYRQVCGRRMFPEPRIVGGSNAAFGRWPWQISLRQWRTSTYLHKCGAALLNENWAITAAHCVDNVPPSDLLLRLGEYDLAEEEEPYPYQERRVQIVASHPQFDPRTFEYDLALLRFYEPIVFQPNIIPVCVPNSDQDFIGQTAFVTGWGRLYEDGPLPSVLQEVAVPVINNTICESMYRAAGYIEHIPHIFICAGWKKGGYDSCEGDSGGPMVLQREEDKRFQLGGVISWGIGCAEANQPGVYTRISEFRDWINQILQF